MNRLVAAAALILVMGVAGCSQSPEASPKTAPAPAADTRGQIVKVGPVLMVEGKKVNPLGRVCEGVEPALECSFQPVKEPVRIKTKTGMVSMRAEGYTRLSVAVTGDGQTRMLKTDGKTLNASTLPPGEYTAAVSSLDFEGLNSPGAVTPAWSFTLVVK